MHNYPQNDTFLDYNLKLHKMIDMHLKYDNIYNVIQFVISPLTLSVSRKFIYVGSRSSEFKNVIALK